MRGWLTEGVSKPPSNRTRLPPWWALLIICALILGILVILALKTSTPVILIAEAISVVLLAVAALVKALENKE